MMLNLLKLMHTFLAIYYVLTSNVIALPTINTVLMDSLLSDQSNGRALDTLDSNDVKVAPLLPPLQRRGVITPRICYFARDPGRRTYQKLCLPYNDSI